MVRPAHEETLAAALDDIDGSKALVQPSATDLSIALGAVEIKVRQALEQAQSETNANHAERVSVLALVDEKRRGEHRALKLRTLHRIEALRRGGGERRPWTRTTEGDAYNLALLDMKKHVEAMFVDNIEDPAEAELVAAAMAATLGK